MAAERDFYLSRLYPLQDRILAWLASIDTGFYPSGGTAASQGYLHHRFSDDLDFFVNDDDRFGLWAQRVVQTLVGSGEWTVAVIHAGQLKRDPVLGLLDSAENILANKLTAVAGNLGTWPTSGASSAVRWGCPAKSPSRTRRARPPACSRRTWPARS
jgi:hypothetical protein